MLIALAGEHPFATPRTNIDVPEVLDIRWGDAP